MKINYNNSGILSVALDGCSDTTTALKLESFFGKNDDAIDSLLIDCVKLPYNPSAGLRALFAAQKRIKEAMKLTNVCELAGKVFEMTGFAANRVIE